MFLKLSGMIEGQLRDAYAKKHAAGLLNQSSLADKLGVNRSAVHHRLTGKTNMTIETIADMVWGLDHDIELKIFDPIQATKNYVAAPTAGLIHGTTKSLAADTPLMKIASAAPSANTNELQILGRQRPAAATNALSNYSAQLVGAKR
jgi:hypothetical protein